MGKAVPKGIKSRANAAMKTFPDSFGSDFDKNKLTVNDLGLPLSKTDRNLVAGFLTRTIRTKNRKAEKEKALVSEAVRAEAAKSEPRTE